MATSTTTVGAPPKSGELLSERIAPGILPKVLGRFDMIAIFVAIVLFAVQGSVVQPAGASAFVYWILGFVTFLIPGAIVTGQLGPASGRSGSPASAGCRAAIPRPTTSRGVRSASTPGTPPFMVS